ncbi:MAG TPA: type II toxin-antitoxin system VapB family antitoxin [Promineifilum sp.]|nr:type II toxin-antitoxin system VapB family antitoxin [Promineifilum sp.]HRO25283.1 type II toxin-antitoxin system VapB family antitoxin [Promineifilum sp.]HRO91533.1 type II toxin-antitoxin system VapB family antitoxin [Promineifilum sp.]HRQ12944.1 type II toxin-antitoxin system VapB family antitoxin [Promineifilum sp.]
MDTARIFIHDNDQAICLPEGYRFEGTEVYIQKVGNVVVLSPVAGSWQTLIDSLGQFSDDFMENREQPDV